MSINFSRYFVNKSLFDVSKKKPSDWNDFPLIVDGTNVFIRSFAASNTISENGEHCGGVVAFFNALTSSKEFFAATRCIVVFDGSGGSTRRKILYPQYKSKRTNKLGFNRIVSSEDANYSEEDSMIKQFRIVLEMLSFFSIPAVIIDNVEGDDSISYLHSVFSRISRQIFIVSSDNDFIQLIDDKTLIWNPAIKKVVDKPYVLNKFKILPENFIIYKCICGDKTDAINGLGGIGPGKLHKYMPELAERPMTLDEVVELSKDKHRSLHKIHENREILERNYKLMSLKDINVLSPASALEISRSVNIEIKNFNLFEFSRYLLQHGLNTLLSSHRLYSILATYPGITSFSSI